MYNNRNTSSEYKKILRERLKRRIKEDEKKYKKEAKLYEENRILVLIFGIYGFIIYEVMNYEY